MQLRKINDSGDKVCPAHVRRLQASGEQTLVVDGVDSGYGLPGVLSSWPREKIEYVLTMRDECDPLPEWMERPAITGINREDDIEDVSHGIEVRRSGNREAMNEDQEIGWDAQDAIARAFWDDHVTGWE